MLNAETKEGIRRAAERCSSSLSDAERETKGQAAHRVKDSLREMGFTDNDAASAAYMVAALMAVLNGSRVRELVELVEGTMDSYMLAAGSLAGVYELPLRRGDEDGEGPVPPNDPEPVAPSRAAGPYL